MKIDLRKGDCLKVMKDIPDGSVDLILTDPPYGTTACKWDTVINLELMWKELKRIIKPNGAIVIFGAEPFSSFLRMSNIKEYKYDWVWIKSKPTGHLNSKKQPLRQTENVSVFYLKQCKYKPQGVFEIKEKEVSRTNRGNYGKCSKTTFQKISGFPKNILSFKIEGKGLHPTQKPVPLLEYLIKTYTDECETVLDFTMGSGSTGVACVNTNRSFIGIELDDNYFNIAEERIKKSIEDKKVDL